VTFFLFSASSNWLYCYNNTNMICNELSNVTLVHDVYGSAVLGARRRLPQLSLISFSPLSPLANQLCLINVTSDVFYDYNIETYGFGSIVDSHLVQTAQGLHTYILATSTPNFKYNYDMAL